jgi:hypothetical protein
MNTLEDDEDSNNIADSEEAEITSEEKVLIEVQRKRATRIRQRMQTKEIGVLDLIDDSNRGLRKLLRLLNLSSDAFDLVMGVVTSKDRELIRLRRELLRVRSSLEATRKNIIPRLRSKAHQAKILQEAANAVKNQRMPRGRMARTLVRET